jgi:DNA topoisomerase-1
LGNDPASGKPITVRLGRYGAFAQIGTKEAGDAPRYASLRPGQSLHTISLPEAVELFKLPRNLGAAPDGQEVGVAIGRFGPFVKHGKIYASLGAGDDPYTIDLARALAVLKEKEEAAAKRLIASFDDGAIQVLNGRYGPYITDGSKNARIPKDREPASLSRDECAELLAAAPLKAARGRGRGNGSRAAGPAATAAAAPIKAPASVKRGAKKEPAAAKAKLAPAGAKKAAKTKRGAASPPAKRTAG